MVNSSKLVFQFGNSKHLKTDVNRVIGVNNGIIGDAGDGGNENGRVNGVGKMRLAMRRQISTKLAFTVNRNQKWNGYNGNILPNNNNSTDGISKPNDERIWYQAKLLWNQYCSKSTVHGLRYISDEDIHMYERFIWMILVLVAAFGIVYVSLLIQMRFFAFQRSTVVESTIYPIYEIPYPAVTICNYNRVNAQRIDSVIKYFLPTQNETLHSKLRNFIFLLNGIEMGSFFELIDTMDDEAYTLTEFDHIDVFELYNKITIRCSELFYEPSCWWRNQFYNCCDIFTEQRSEHGLCVSFNSVTTKLGKHRVSTEADFPWRTSNSGYWSGLRIQLKINEKMKIANPERMSGLQVLINDPFQWPTLADFLAIGTFTPVAITPTYYYAQDDVNGLAPEVRECVYPEEVNKNGSKYETLPGTMYTYSNCLSQCRNVNIMKLCNCFLNILYPESLDNVIPPCRIRDFKCIAHLDKVITYFKPPADNVFFGANYPGINCSCLPECNRVNYEIELYPNRDVTGAFNESLDFDIHFRRDTLIKYRTEIVFTWIDLLVSFGGIAGLFLGISLLSLAEIGFFLLMGIGRVIHHWKVRQQKKRQVIRFNNNLQQFDNQTKH